MRPTRVQFISGWLCSALHLFSLPALAQQADTLCDPDAFLISLHKTHAISSVSYLYEGSVTCNDKDRKTADRLSYVFTGYYLNHYQDYGDHARDALSDATYADVYIRNADDLRKVSHKTYAFLSDSVKTLFYPVGRRPALGDVKTGKTRNNILRQMHIPDMMFMHKSLFRFQEGDPVTSKLFGIATIETVDGSPTHVFVLDHRRGTKGEGGLIWKYWVDTAKGFNVVKYEHRLNGKLIEAVDQVVLQQISRGNDPTAWYPIKACYRSYNAGPREQPSDEALFSAELRVLRDTLVINRPVSESMFSVFYRHGTEQSSVLRSLEKDFAARSSRSSEKGKSFESVEELLMQEIKEADEVSARLRGSSIATGLQGLVASHWSQLLFTFGFAIFMGSAVWGFKNRFTQGFSRSR
jgi:hypothetical protein